MTSGARMLLHYCDGGVTTSWEKAPRERGRPARTNPGIASLISSTRIERQRRHGSASAGPRRFPPAGGAGCGIAGKLSGNPRDSMRARRPRSRGVLSRWCAGGYPAGDFSESRPAPFGKLPFVREPCPRRAVRIKPECNNQKSTIPSRPWYPGDIEPSGKHAQPPPGRTRWSLRETLRIPSRLTVSERLGGGPSSFSENADRPPFVDNSFFFCFRQAIASLHRSRQLQYS